MPDGLTVKAASNGGQTAGNKLSWDLGSLAASGSQNVSATFVSANAGSYQFSPAAKGACAKPVDLLLPDPGGGHPAILLEKSDDPDPVGVGETTTYTVKITNQGTRMITTCAWW